MYIYFCKKLLTTQIVLKIIDFIQIGNKTKLEHTITFHVK